MPSVSLGVVIVVFVILPFNPSTELRMIVQPITHFGLVWYDPMSPIIRMQRQELELASTSVAKARTATVNASCACITAFLVTIPPLGFLACYLRCHAYPGLDRGTMQDILPLASLLHFPDILRLKDSLDKEIALNLIGLVVRVKVEAFGRIVVPFDDRLEVEAKNLLLFLVSRRGRGQSHLLSWPQRLREVLELQMFQLFLDFFLFASRWPFIVDGRRGCC